MKAAGTHFAKPYLVCDRSESATITNKLLNTTNVVVFDAGAGR